MRTLSDLIRSVNAHTFLFHKIGDAHTFQSHTIGDARAFELNSVGDSHTFQYRAWYVRSVMLIHSNLIRSMMLIHSNLIRSVIIIYSNLILRSTINDAYILYIIISHVRSLMLMCSYIPISHDRWCSHIPSSIGRWCSCIRMRTEQRRLRDFDGRVGRALRMYLQIFSTNRCVYFSSGCRCLVRVANRELRLTTYGRQSNVPIFSPNRCTRRHFVFTDLWWTYLRWYLRWLGFVA